MIERRKNEGGMEGRKREREKTKGRGRKNVSRIITNERKTSKQRMSKRNEKKNECGENRKK